MEDKHGAATARHTHTHTHSSLARATQIALVLANHELWYLVEVLDLGRFVPVHLHKNAPSSPDSPRLYTEPEQLRMAFEELGPTFMKLGQMLSTRTDLLPPDYQRELAKLQDDAPTISFETVRETITAELGRPLEQAFATFDATPLAAASLGQAHLATLQDGTEVVVKVRRPGAVEQVDEDLKLLHSLASIASHRWKLARQYDVVGLVQEFDQALRAELDYLHEGRNAERFARNFAADSQVQIPRVFGEISTSRVLTLERLQGMKVTDLAALDTAGIDRTDLSHRFAQMLLKTVFEDGFFHADLHPGNLFIEKQGRVGLIDFGMVGTVDADTRNSLERLLFGMARQDTDRVVDALLALGVTQQPVDRSALRRDLEQSLMQYYDQPLSAIALGPLLAEVLGIVRHHQLVLPSNLLLLFKTMAMGEGMGVQLNPSFHLAEVLTPYAKQLIFQQNSPSAWMKRLGKADIELAWLATDLPQRLRRLLDDLDRGVLKIDVQPTGLDPMIRRVERIANRIVLGVVVAAFIIALAVLMSVYHPAGSTLGQVLFLIGFVLAVVLALYLIWCIFRSDRY
jgi:ubiquinone biosynthesis protein